MPDICSCLLFNIRSNISSGILYSTYIYRRKFGNKTSDKMDRWKNTTARSKLKCGKKKLHLIMGQKHLIWDRVWNVRSTRSNLYLHLIYSIYMYTYMFFISISYAPIILWVRENPPSY